MLEEEFEFESTFKDKEARGLDDDINIEEV